MQINEAQLKCHVRGCILNCKAQALLYERPALISTPRTFAVTLRIWHCLLECELYSVSNIQNLASPILSQAQELVFYRESVQDRRDTIAHKLQDILLEAKELRCLLTLADLTLELMPELTSSVVN